jgi:hypothetical protein
MQESQSLIPLPETTPAQPFSDLVTRARSQALAATECFYLNKWQDLEEIAKVMSQTARFMERATGIPAARQQQVLAIAAEIVQESSKLSTLAKSHDEPATQQCLQRIQVKVRELHEKP